MLTKTEVEPNPALLRRVPQVLSPPTSSAPAGCPRPMPRPSPGGCWRPISPALMPTASFASPAMCASSSAACLNPRATITVLERGPATALIDGDQGLGHVVMSYAGQARDRARALLRRRLGRRAPLQPRRRRRDLCGDPARAQYGRHLRRGLERASHGAVGRHRAVARHQSDRGRPSPPAPEAPVIFDIATLGRVERRHQDPPAPRPADAGRLGAEPQGRFPYH